MKTSSLFASLLLLVGTTTASVLGKSPHPASPHNQLQQQQRQQRPLQVADEDIGLSIDEHDLKRVIDQSPLLSFHRDIVQIESISENEADVGEFIIQFLQDRDFTVEKQVIKETDTDAVKKPRFNIYAYPASSPSPKILLTSHIDTVPPFIPYSLSLPTNSSSAGESWRDDLMISGRGSVDAKASVAAQIFAVLEYLQSDPEASLGFLFVVGEERSGTGMSYFSKSPLNTSPPTFHTVIFGEPTDLALVSGHKGMLGFKVIAKGQAAHSGYPWLGRSAVSALLPALVKIDQLGDIPAEDGGLPSSQKFGKTTVNIGHMEGGVAPNVVPSSAYAEVAIRLAFGDVDLAKDIILKAVHDSTAGNEDVTVELVNNSPGAPPVDFDTDVDGFNVTTVNYGTDAYHLHIHEGAGGSPHGRVRRYLYGPGSIFVAHGDHEALRVWEVEEAVRGYKKLIDAAIERNKVERK
jgi:acetylornithine deacetylase